MKSDILICGAGAAGLTAAIFAAQEQLSQGKRVSVVVLERTNQAGRKILMSGGTRCNVLPVRMSLDDYVTSSSKNSLKKIFKSWSLESCKTWFEEDTGLALSCEAETNKWFPKSNSAIEVRDCLLNYASRLGVTFMYNQPVTMLSPGTGKTAWTVKTSAGLVVESCRVILCSGGYSIPKTGTDGMGHRIAAGLGHNSASCYPALTPLTTANQKHHELAGISLDVVLEVRSNQKKIATSNRGGFLFTHRGYSGPSVLDLSHFQNPEFRVADSKLSGGREENTAVYKVNWTGISADEWNRKFDGKETVQALLRKHLPARLADSISDEIALNNRKTAELNKKERKKLLTLLCDYPLSVNGDEGYKKAEVTGGGIPLSEVNASTMESHYHPGLFLCGEILDIFGRIGGFNFYWAWVSGRLAGISAVNSLS
ncbi:MAG: aminoacetone oxidase family FAD-binding enzyme [Balneolales bacterium]|nr:aminoacetone oxidase family FAD-binding enzyme [Balneolales bacterium]